MPKILIADAISDTAIELLKNSGVGYVYLPEISASELFQTIDDFEAIIVRSRTRLSREVIDKARKLKVIGRAGVGVDNIDIAASKEHGIKVVNTPDALTNAVAEFTIGLMLSLARAIPKADSLLKSGKWAKSSTHGTELKGKVYGTVGIGRIGARVAELSYAFGMKIMANDVIPIPEGLIRKLNIEVSTQEKIFSDADYVDLHVPLTEETRYLVNYEKLSRMKKGSFLINTARGKIVNETDLLRALKEGKIAGAALDVFETEPPTLEELLKESRLIITPHIAGQTVESQDEAGRLVVKEVLSTLS
ncbi:MAG TPA: hydroxyacid dehydrogenase [Nitrososphaerales archaeon]|nr:hydroxyacid dehydrogenase [Nitrososphaerales archaeon]